MISILIGQAFFQIIVAKKKLSVSVLLLISICIAFTANVILVISTHPGHHAYDLSYAALILFQIGVGLYFPSMGFLRSHIIPDTHRWSIINWFRVPINIIACIVLMLLHEDVFQHGNRMIFVICVMLLFLAILSGFRLHTISKNHDGLKQEAAWLESDHILNIF